MNIGNILVMTFFPDTEFFHTQEALMDYVFEQDPDVIICCTLVRTLIINALADDSRFYEQYRFAYIVGPNMFFEKKGRFNEPVFLPSGVFFASSEEELTIRHKNHVLIQALQKHREF